MNNILNSVAAAALVVTGSAAYAQQAPAADQATSGAAATTTAERLDHDGLKDRLGEAGVEDREDFEGFLLRAVSPEGHPTIMLVGPEDMAGDDSIDFSGEEMTGRLAEVGFTDINYLADTTMVRGAFDDEDKAVLAVTAADDWHRIAATAPGSTPDRDRLEEQLESAGVEDRDELEGVLVHARTDEGQTVLILFGPENFEGDESIELTADDVARLQNGFEFAEVLENLIMVRGGIDDDKAVVTITGAGLSLND